MLRKLDGAGGGAACAANGMKISAKTRERRGTKRHNIGSSYIGSNWQELYGLSFYRSVHFVHAHLVLPVPLNPFSRLGLCLTQRLAPLSPLALDPALELTLPAYAPRIQR